MSAPRVLVNDRCLHRGGAGVSTYLRGVLDHWPADAAVQVEPFWPHLPGWLRARLATAERPLPPLKLQPLSSLAPPAASRPKPVVRRLLQWAYARLYEKVYARGDFAASWEPNHLADPVPGPIVTTIHDLSVVEHPEWHPPDRTAQWQANLTRTLRITDRWVAVSQFTRGRMVQMLRIDPERIEVIPLAARGFPAVPPDQAAARLAAAGVPARYVLHLGTLEPRKNLPLLLDAWAELSVSWPDAPALVLAGGVGWGGKAFFQSLAEHPIADRVWITGYISIADAGLLLRGARAVCLPSLYEGFGLPVLEAMSAGVPVLCSRIAVFQEVAADAAELLPADSPSAWSEAVRRLDEDESARARLATAGATRAAEFNWPRTAAAHAEVLGRAASERA